MIYIDWPENLSSIDQLRVINACKNEHPVFIAVHVAKHD